MAAFTSAIRRAAAPALLAVAVALAAVPAAKQGIPGVAPGSGGINRPDHLRKPFLLLVSFDGFRADYLDRFVLPSFRRISARGARARAMRPVFPSITFPNHYSLVTGLHPGHHGIVENSFFDPVRNATYSFRNQATVTDGSWYGGEPIWVTAERQGMVAASYFWPGSEAAIKGVRPTIWNKYDGGVANAERVSTVLGWLRLPPETRPHVITLYFSDVDSMSHRVPLDAPEIESTVKRVDATLGTLLDGLDALPDRDRVILLLTSDHGMTDTSAEQTIQLGSLVETSNIQVGYSGPVTGLHVSGGPEAARRLRDQLNARLTHGRAYLRRDTPERYHFRDTPRAGDVVVLMDEGWTMASSMLTRALIQRRWGEHGWPPDVDSMRAIFILAGPGIRRGVTIPEVENVDVYPLMAELLGLTPATGIDGKAGKIGSLVRDR